MKTFCLFFVLSFAILPALGQKSSSQNEVNRLVNILKEKHYSPKSIDDNFSYKLFYKFMSALDERHLYFLRPEIIRLNASELYLDNELYNHQLRFIEQVSPLYVGAMERSRKILEGLKAKPFRIVKNEIYTPNYKDTLDYALDETELALRWEKYLKLHTFLKDYENTQDSIAPKPSLQEIYLKVIAKALHKVNDDILACKGSLKPLYYEYAVCIAALFDPHSSYMSYNDYQNFESMLSTEDYKFGITIDKNKFGAIEVVRVTPGSPAWKSGKINIGDVITHLKWQNGEKIELADMEFQEVTQMLDLSNNLYLEFTIHSADGDVQVLSLKKEKASSSENVVKGYVLTGKDNKKIGYICLPSFYTLFESENMLGCANDVAKELVKLQQENIEGLLFDLRNNGGGSLKEGLELSGIFINEGTLAVCKEKGTAPISMKDWNRGVAYAGPMVVMVNGHSASASELMASTLQDYNRAVIVGSDTYGKATGQELYSLNPTESGVPDSLKAGFASVTILKLYRVTGKSNQVSGLHPDIVLPDPFLNLYENESKEPEALPKDTVMKKTYYQPLPALPLAKLRAQSEERVKNKEEFTKVKKLATQYATVFDLGNEPILLSLEAVKKVCEDYENWLDGIRKDYYAKTNSFTVKSTNVDESLQQLSEEDRILSDYAMKRIQRDLVLEESYLILNDLINQK
ncbi:MAG TPA: carboxy terminal-processing peptidase [Cytophagaceae bacterium]|nr:carboxy terminal-processing peptidase [Cytophagaceae bacterium]